MAAVLADTGALVALLDRSDECGFLPLLHSFSSSAAFGELQCSGRVGYKHCVNISILRELHKARPFVPFTISLAGGRRLEVARNEFLSFFPGGRAAMLTHDDDRFTSINLLLVASVDVDPKFRSRRKPAKKS